MKSLIILFLILTSISNIKGDYSIDTLLNYLQEKGIYDLLAEIKYCYGNDISINVCKELVQSSDCETVVRVYISSRSNSRSNEGSNAATNIINYYYQILRKAGYNPYIIDKIAKIMMNAA